ncbi:MAG: UDP-N-acetylmuramoyl-L-alanine--D-glutamate ligase [Thermodesulfobacteria bacterium]|nr:UDP-N-acetylmuramoyl-L-alanine--D-glutamate ligase [Thermodesulfobacteriota bacterium]
MDLKGKKVVVIGLGKSGESAVKLLLSRGAEVLILEKKEEHELNPRMVEEVKKLGAELVTGTQSPEFAKGKDLVVVSPGVPKEVYSGFSKFCPVIGELELAWELLESKPQTVAITGTNGKTTTTAMVSEILKTSGYRVFTGGNYGIPLSELVLRGTKVDRIVLEVSSFQLETIKEFSPNVGILLNITPDHLERYESEKEYAEYKYRMFENQKEEDKAVLYCNLPYFEEFKEKVKGKVYTFGECGGEARLIGENRFSLKPGQGEEVYSFDGFKLLGLHNKLNYLAASLAARLLGASPSAVQKLVREFTGFPHRMEFVAEVGGVYFVNDSKATNVDATLQALKSSVPPVILIMGGRHKGAGYTSLIPYLGEKVKLLILMGEARWIIGEQIGGVVETLYAKNLDEAVLLAIKRAQSGDTVLLSPGCSSFDEFNSYEERGQRFRELVWKYAPKVLEEKGERVWH